MKIGGGMMMSLRNAAASQINELTQVCENSNGAARMGWFHGITRKQPITQIKD